MELQVNPTVCLKVGLKTPEQVELIDSLVVTPAIKENLLLPYLSSLFEGLVLRAASPSLGVPRYALTEVKY